MKSKVVDVKEENGRVIAGKINFKRESTECSICMYAPHVG